MTADERRVLSVAARSGRLGCVVLEGAAVQGWTTSERGARSAVAAVQRLRGWVHSFEPDILVSERPDATCRKRGRQRSILRAFLEVGEDMQVRHLVVQRQRRFPNIYLEAADLAQCYPDLPLVAPRKPPIWKKEPYRLVIFEALALVRDAGLAGEDDEVKLALPNS